MLTSLAIVIVSYKENCTDRFRVECNATKGLACDVQDVCECEIEEE